MPRPRPPSRIDAVATPLFGICWYGDPGNGTSIVAHCGGGGSAATGVRNTVTVVTCSDPPTDEVKISTGNQVGVTITVIRNPITGKLRLYVGLGMNVNVYDLPSGELQYEISVGDNVNAIAVNSLTSRLAVGCDDGKVRVFAMDNKDDSISELKIPMKILEGHEKAVCAVAFAPRGEDRLVSAAKDGTARVWQGNDCMGVLKCSILDPKGPPPKILGQILVRGCAFGDLMGNVVYTVASGRRGKAFLSRWVLGTKDGYQCDERTECSTCPVSSMSLSGDAGMIALGATDGTVILWNIEKWKAMKQFPEVHDLPVTCIAARPYPVPLLCDQDSDGIQMHAISASADSQLAWLTMQRRGRAKSAPSDLTLKSVLNSMVKLAILGWLFYPVAHEINDKCQQDLYTMSSDNIGKAWECIRYEVLLAPTTRPGIAVPPY